MRNSAPIETTRFHNLIHRGYIETIAPDKSHGIIRADTGESIRIYSKQENLEKFKIGDHVVFEMIPSRLYTNRWNAKNVRRAYRSKDGFIVADRVVSHIHGDLTDHLKTIIKKVDCNGEEHFHRVLSFPKNIGNVTCVKVDWKDEIVYAKRVGRTYHSKFVKNRLPEPSSFVTIILKKVQGIYLIISCYFGNVPELKPDFDNEQNTSHIFWDNHAIIYGSEPIDPKTETIINPWTRINENNTMGAMMKALKID